MSDTLRALDAPGGELAEEQVVTPRVTPNAATTGRLAGNAKWVVARRPARGYSLKRCAWCRQEIQPGELCVVQDRWLFWKGRYFPAGRRHDRCWGLENDHG